jgi:NitT/TauT family transport system substrate-binding protein
MIEIRIGHLSTAYHTSLVLMGKREWEVDAGLALKWELYPTGPRIIEAMMAGDLDLGYVGLPPVIVGIDKDARLKCVAGGHVEGTVLIAGLKYRSLEELDYKTRAALKQFEGRCIGSPSRGSIHDVVIRDLLKREGLAGKVAVKNYPWADLLVNALEEGEVDAAIGTPSLAAVAMEGSVGRIIFSPSQLWPFNPSYGIVAREEFITEVPKAIESFLRIHRKASILIREHPQRASGIISKVIGVVDEEFVLTVLGISQRYCTGLPREFIEATMAFAKTLRDLGYIKRHLREEDIFDRSFIKRVHPEAHHY